MQEGGGTLQVRLIYLLVLACLLASYFGAALKIPTLGFHEGGGW